MISKKLTSFLKMGRVLSKEDSSLLFDEIYFTKGSKIKRQVFYIVGSSLYEDVLQEVFFKIHKNLHKFNNQSSIDTWIYKIALNTSLDFLNKEKKRSKSSFEDDEFGIDSRRVNEENSELKDLVQKSIFNLSDKHKKVFILFYISGESIKNISAVLNIPEGTVKSRLNNARESVKIFLKKHGVNYE